MTSESREHPAYWGGEAQAVFVPLKGNWLLAENLKAEHSGRTSNVAFQARLAKRQVVTTTEKQEFGRQATSDICCHVERRGDRGAGKVQLNSHKG